MSYNADISSREAFEMLLSDKDTYLIDVRTMPEWSLVGLPDLKEIGKDTYMISWMTYPNMELDRNFVEKVSEVSQDKNSNLLFLCKSGGRSAQAANAAAKAGYKNCFNISDGFEGNLNDMEQRGKVNGWKASGLPWKQS
jgi:rhodanese-related sulfurtransferase